MTKKELFQTLRERFSEFLKARGIENDTVSISCRALSPEEAIGKTERRDFPILTGKDIMIQAEYHGCYGQAFTDSPATYTGSLDEILTLDLENDPHGRGIFVATMNAVMCSAGLCRDTVHCRTDGPELCAKDMLQYLRANYPHVKKIGLVGYQPALLEMLSRSEYHVRVLDLNPANVGQTRYGVLVEDGVTDRQAVIDYADLILCTGSTLCNGTIINFLDLPKEVVFFGITAAGAAPLLGLKRACFADQYS